jgi:hypothetical protein
MTGFGSVILDRTRLASRLLASTPARLGWGIGGSPVSGLQSAHQRRMQYAEFGYLTVRGCRWHRKPIRVVGQIDCLP